MSLNLTNNNNVKAVYANFTNPAKEGYSTQKIGTVLAIQNVQSRAYNPNGPGAPMWAKRKDGSVVIGRDGKPMPVLDLRLVLVDANGQLFQWKTPSLTNSSRKYIAEIQAGAKKKGHIHWDLQMIAPDHNIDNLIGQTILIATEEGNWGLRNPRPWHVALVDDGPFKYDGEVPEIFKVETLLCDDGVSGGQPVVQQQAQPQQPVYNQPMQQQYAQQYQPQMQQPVQQPVYNQPGFQQAQQAQQFFAQGNPQGYAQVAQPTMVQPGVDPYETPWD